MLRVLIVALAAASASDASAAERYTDVKYGISFDLPDHAARRRRCRTMACCSGRVA